MKQRCILLFVNPYHMVDEATGTINEGLSAFYVGTDSLSACSDGDKLGVPVLKQSLSMSLKDDIKVVPGYYDMEFGLRPVGGKPTVVPVGMTFVAAVDAKPDDNPLKSKDVK